VWLAGDVVTSEGTVTHAVGHGRRVAARALAALDGRPEPAAEPARAEELVSPAHVRFGHFEVSPPRRERHLLPEERRSFEEVNRGLDGPEEASRCFSCGSCTRCDTCLLYCPEGIIRREGAGYQIDLDHCKGCGMCVAECPRRAMEMTAAAAVG
jgi:2-oxoacid:acceptor oxidoreductase delta subunit (pyruvate/2-ketoisovalerate family)